MINCHFCCVFLVGLLTLPALGQELPRLYHITPVPDLPGHSSREATDINDAGQVCGYATNAFLWDPVSGIRDLGTLGGPFSTAESVNELGQVVGVGRNTAMEQEAFFWDPVAGMIGLGDLPGAWFNSWARGINDFGDVTGHSGMGDPLEGDGEIGFIWDAVNGMRPIGDLPGGQYVSIANDINNDRWIVGWSASQTQWAEPFLWTPETGIHSLEELNGGVYVGEDAYDINNLGQVVGAGYHGGNGTSGYVWSLEDGLTVIQDPALGWAWHAYGINDSGEVVGENRAFNNEFEGFIWDRKSGMRILRRQMLDAVSRASPYSRVGTAIRINDRGQIIAGTSAPGDVLLTPIVLGDLDCDGSVTSFDVEPFVMALVDADEYQRLHAPCERWAADVNQDARIDAFDIQPFVELLSGP